MAAEQKHPYSSRAHLNRPGAVQAKLASTGTEAQLKFFQSILAMSPEGIAVLRGRAT